MYYKELLNLRDNKREFVGGSLWLLRQKFIRALCL